jgi:hypothetical protein
MLGRHARTSESGKLVAAIAVGRDTPGSGLAMSSSGLTVSRITVMERLAVPPALVMS